MYASSLVEVYASCVWDKRFIKRTNFLPYVSFNSMVITHRKIKLKHCFGLFDFANRFCKFLTATFLFIQNGVKTSVNLNLIEPFSVVIVWKVLFSDLRNGLLKFHFPVESFCFSKLFCWKIKRKIIVCMSSICMFDMYHVRPVALFSMTY